MRAYDELFSRYASKLHKVATRYLKDTGVAEELAMDILFDLWQKRDRYNISGDVSAYLYRSIRNRIIDYRRKNIPLVISLGSLTENALVFSRSADHEILSSEAEAFYYEKMSELSPQRLKVFRMSREENMSYADIARETNLSVSTVEKYIMATLQILRENLKKYSSTTLFTFLFAHFL